MQVKWYEGETGAFHFADQAGDFLGMEQQFTSADRVGLDMGRSARQRGNVHAEDEQLFTMHDDIGFLDVGASAANSLDFPAFKHNPGLIPFLNEEIVTSLTVFDDAHGEVLRGLCVRIAHLISSSAAQMANVQKKVLIEFTPAQMFDLVDRCEDYPHFLPWCSKVDQITRTDEITAATLYINYHGIKSHFSTENSKRAPTEMSIHLKDGPFTRLDGGWRFTPLGETACKVEFELHYIFSNRLLEKILGPVFNHIADTFVEAFVKRANQVYGVSRP